MPFFDNSQEVQVNGSQLTDVHGTMNWNQYSGVRPNARSNDDLPGSRVALQPPLVPSRDGVFSSGTPPENAPNFRIQDSTLIGVKGTMNWIQYVWGHDELVTAQQGCSRSLPPLLIHCDTYNYN